MPFLIQFCEKLQKMGALKKKYSPFPPYSDRKSWNNAVPNERAEIIAYGETFLNYNWPFLPATLYMEFKITGNRSQYEELYFKRRHALGALTIAECLEGKGRFLADITNGIWGICEETSWSVPAHLSRSEFVVLPSPDAPIVDLFAADTGVLLSLIYFIFETHYEEHNPNILERIEAEVQKRIITEYMNNDIYGWLGLSHKEPVNNWNPWINCNVLLTALLLCGNYPQKIQIIEKILRSLDRFIEGYGDDGGCNEGPMYWFVAGGKLLDALDILNVATDGEIDIFAEKRIRNMGRYIALSHIGKGWFVNFADAIPRPLIQGTVIYRYGRLINDPYLTQFGLSHLNFLNEIKGYKWFELFRIGRTLFFPNINDLSNSIIPPPIFNHFNSIQVFNTRSADGKWFLAGKGGHNQESHNHNDVGNFMVYYENQPYIIDIGVGTYTKQTFGAERYSLWMMQSAYHNLPTVNSIQQMNGPNFHAQNWQIFKNDAIRGVKLDIERAYPENANLKEWNRSLLLEDGEKPCIKLTEIFSFSNSAAHIQFSLLTYFMPKPALNAFILNNKLKITYDSEKLNAKIERLELNDPRLSESWGQDHVYRLLFQYEAKNLANEIQFQFNLID